MKLWTDVHTVCVRLCVCVKGQSEMVRANNNFACQKICVKERKREKDRVHSNEEL